MKVDVTVSPFDRQPPDDGHPIEHAIEELIYEHLIDLVDFQRMWELEMVVALRLGDLADSRALPAMSEPALADRAGELIARAWHRLIEDPRRYATFGGDFTTDDDCELCKALAEQEQPDDPPRAHPRSPKS